MARRYREAIAGIESRGSGDYAAVGPDTGKGHRAYGRYQIMDYNIGPWSRQHLGYEVTPEQFLKSPELQDKIFDAQFGQYVQKYGEPGAASMWYTGSPDQPVRTDVLGRLTGPEYTQRFMEGLDVPVDGADVPQERTNVPQIARPTSSTITAPQSVPTPEEVAYSPGALEALLGISDAIGTDEKAKALAARLRGRQRTGQFLSLSQIGPIHDLGTSISGEVTESAKQGGVLREAMARTQAAKDAADLSFERDLLRDQLKHEAKMEEKAAGRTDKEKAALAIGMDAQQSIARMLELYGKKGEDLRFGQIEGDLVSLAGEPGSFTGALLSGIGGIGFEPTDAEREFNNTAAKLKLTLRNLVEKGVSSDQDVRDLMQLIPTTRDDPEAVPIKLDQLRSTVYLKTGVDIGDLTPNTPDEGAAADPATIEAEALAAERARLEEQLKKL